MTHTPGAAEQHLGVVFALLISVVELLTAPQVILTDHAAAAPTNKGGGDLVPFANAQGFRQAEQGLCRLDVGPPWFAFGVGPKGNAGGRVQDGPDVPAQPLPIRGVQADCFGDEFAAQEDGRGEASAVSPMAVFEDGG